jgi:hypothetical protein
MAKAVGAAPYAFYTCASSAVLYDGLQPVHCQGVALSGQENVGTQGVCRLWAVTLDIFPYSLLYPGPDGHYSLLIPLAVYPQNAVLQPDILQRKAGKARR